MILDIVQLLTVAFVIKNNESFPINSISGLVFIISLTLVCGNTKSDLFLVEVLVLLLVLVDCLLLDLGVIVCSELAKGIIETNFEAADDDEGDLEEDFVTPGLDWLALLIVLLFFIFPPPVLPPPPLELLLPADVLALDLFELICDSSTSTTKPERKQWTRTSHTGRS